MSGFAVHFITRGRLFKNLVKIIFIFFAVLNQARTWRMCACMCEA